MLTTEQQAWQRIVEILLDQHLGLTLNDTSFCEENRVANLCDAGIRPYEAVNELIEKYQLVIFNDNPAKPPASSLCAVDELIAHLQSTGDLQLGRKR